METKNQKIMLIVWRWRNLKHVNELSYTEEEIEYFLTDISHGQGHFYQEYPVIPSDLCSHAKVIAVAIYKNHDSSRALLEKLIEQYATPANELMVFLHRGNHYEDSDVDELMSRFGANLSKCFLFALGRDFLYYHVQGNGLLDEAGGFYDGTDKLRGNIRVSTIEKDENKNETYVKQPFFDRVWQHYKIEFETKVLYLKEDLFDCWYPIIHSSKEHLSHQDLVNEIQLKNKPLWYRLKSFMGLYEVLKTLDKISDFETIYNLSEEKKIIINAEKKNKLSYMFDDCIANLEHERKQGNDFIYNAYTEARQALGDILLDSKAKVVSKQELRSLAGKLDYLIKVIPGELD